ncbi:MAG: ATP-dependent Clp protease proteolytic subunit, partial [Desulfatitalea sp.]
MRRMIPWLMALILTLPGVAFAKAAVVEKHAEVEKHKEAEDSGKTIMLVTVADPIGPGVAEFLEDALQKASEEQAACLIIKLDTPGGSVEAMRKIVQAMYACEVPVVVYVSPSGARAASAGVMITMAADIAAMAPGTNIGAAHPVGAGGKDLDESMTEK